MQLMPATAASLGVTDSFDPVQNIDGGVRYLASRLQLYDGDVLRALAAYNCGQTRLANLGVTDLTDPAQFALLPRETQSYITRIEGYLESMGTSLTAR
jgi:soluble lytic murein transglycosylase-like protein